MSRIWEYKVLFRIPMSTTIKIEHEFELWNIGSKFKNSTFMSYPLNLALFRLARKINKEKTYKSAIWVKMMEGRVSAAMSGIPTATSLAIGALYGS